MYVPVLASFVMLKRVKPEDVDIFEPGRVAKSVKLMGAKHLVITSVDRDDLIDGGVSIWAATIKAIRHQAPGVTLETLIPDFQGKKELLDKIIEVNPEVVSHNIETVERLSRQVRIQAQYKRSLEVLNYLKENGIRRTKSGIMLGLGESEDEIVQSLDDLRAAQVDIVTMGQYLQPTRKHLAGGALCDSPEDFKRYETLALGKGFYVCREWTNGAHLAIMQRSI
jgi:lipoic acid synthetase